MTRLGLYGGPRGPYGSFSKGATKVFTTTVTRHALYGSARIPYGDFSGKESVVGHVTRLALYGGARPRYGVFIGKVGGGVTGTPQFQGLRQNIGRMMR